MRLAIREGVAWITLSRPGRGNRVDQATAQAFCDLLDTIELDDRIALAVLSAAGPAFCLGVEEGGPWQGRFDWVASLGRLTRPVIAALNGPAEAEGFEMALACDLRIASTRAAFRLPQLVFGSLPRHGGTQRLPRLIGRLRAMDLLLTGRRMGAREAAAVGLVTRVVAPDRLATALRQEVDLLAGHGPLALRLAKEAVCKGLDLTFEQGIRLEHDLYVLLQTTADRGEGIRAFHERRRPRFSGR